MYIKFWCKNVLCLITFVNYLQVMPISCQICGRWFKSTYSLRRHEDAHRGIFKFFCPYCQKGFYNKHALQGHMVSHTMVKEFKCSICAKEYRYKKDYVIHMNQKHSKEHD